VSRGVAPFATPPDQAARFITVHTPGGFGGFHTAAAAGEQEGEPLGVPELIGLAPRFDWQLAGPPLLPTGQLAGPGELTSPPSRPPASPTPVVRSGLCADEEAGGVTVG
jgi:hypothetical protein